MLSYIAAAQIDDLRLRLERCGQLPARARRFHGDRIALAREVAALAQPWWRLWVDRTRLEHLADRVALLEQLAPDLGALARECEQLELRIGPLTELAMGLEDPEIERWIGETERLWRVTLATLPGNLNRSAALPDAHTRLAELRAELERTAEGLHRLGEAGRRLAVARSRPQTDPLAIAASQAALRDLEERLLADGVSLEWLTAVRRTLEALPEEEPEVEGAATVDREVLRGLLDRLRRWSEEVGECGAEVTKLERRFNASIRGWRVVDPDGLEEVRRGAEALVEDLQKRAAELRRKETEKLHETLVDLERALGPDASLSEALAQLQALPPGDPRGHREWMAAAADLYRRFGEVASTSRLTLETRLGQRLSTMEQRLDALEERRLSRRAATAVADLRLRLQALAGPGEVLELLRTLRAAQALDEEIAKLEGTAAQEEMDAAESRRRLEQKRRALEDAELLCNLSASVFEETISEEPEDMEVLQRCLAESEARQREGECRFVATCSQEISENLTLARRFWVEEAGGGATAPPLPTIDILGLPEGSDPGEAARLLVASRMVRRLAKRRTERALETLEARRREALAALEALASRPLRPGQQDTVQQLQGALSGDEWPDHEDPFERLQRRRAVLDPAERYLGSLRQEEERVRELSRQLRQRLAALRDEGLLGGFPEIESRIEALVHGVPDHPRRWSESLEQLRNAEDLLEPLERHARRLAAMDLEAAAEVLRSREPSRFGGPAGGASSAALTELASCDEAALPPRELRHRVLVTAGRSRG